MLRESLTVTFTLKICTNKPERVIVGFCFCTTPGSPGVNFYRMRSTGIAMLLLSFSRVMQKIRQRKKSVAALYDDQFSTGHCKEQEGE